MNLSESVRNNLKETVKTIPVYRLGQEEYKQSFDNIRLDDVGVTLENIELYKRVDTSNDAPDKVNYLIISDVRWDGDPSVSQPTTYNITDNKWEDEPNPAILGVYDENLDIDIYSKIDEVIREKALALSQSGTLSDSEQVKEVEVTNKDKEEQIKRAQEYIKNNPDDPDNQELYNLIDRLTKELKDDYDNHKVDRLVDALRNSREYKDALNDYKEWKKDCDMKDDWDVGELNNCGRKVNSIVKKIANDVDPEYSTSFIEDEYSDKVNSYLVKSNYKTPSENKEEKPIDHYANKHDDSYCIAAASDLVADMMSNKYNGDSWKNLPKDRVMNDIVEFTNVYNNGNVEPEYKDEDFYGDYANPEDVYNYLIKGGN